MVMFNKKVQMFLRFFNPYTEYTLFMVLFILGLAGGIISIMLSAYTCRAICSPRTEAVGTVRYTRAAVSDDGQ